MEFFELTKARFSDAKKMFNQGATQNQLAELESLLGFSLPESYRNFLSIHNGESNYFGVFLGFKVLSIAEIICELVSCKSEYIARNRNIISFSLDRIKEDCFNPNWLPIATDGSGNYMAIDFDPDEKGKSGQVISHGRNDKYRYVLADDFSAWLDFVAYESNSHCALVEIDGSSQVSWRNHSCFFDFLPDVFQEAELRKAGKLLDWNSLGEAWTLHIKKLLGPRVKSIVDLEHVQELDISHSKITTLAPVALFKNVTELIASGLVISDFSSLKNLKTLETILLMGTNLSDLDYFEGFKKLSILLVGNTQVTCLSVLPTLPALTELSLHGLWISDYSPLFKCKKLKVLSLVGSNFSEFNQLSTLTTLTTLRLSFLEIPDLKFISSLSKLERIEFTDTDIDDFSPLLALPKLAFIQCPFEIFEKTHHLFKQKINYSMIGEGTKKQHALWRKYTDSKG